MMCRCNHCGSRFFKTLETRVLKSSVENEHRGTLLLKKRCKRCKFKLIFKLILPERHYQLASYHLWEIGIRIENLPTAAINRFQLTASDFSRRISRAAEDTQAYLKKIQRAQGGGHG